MDLPIPIPTIKQHPNILLANNPYRFQWTRMVGVPCNK
jgi:hypothetical protein